MPYAYDRPLLRCVELKQAGWKQTDTAQAFGLIEGWVSRSLKTYLEQAEPGLITGNRTEAPSRLKADQLHRLIKELNKGAEQHGFLGQVLTRPRIKALINRIFSVSYDPFQVGQLLKKVCWSRYKPARQARHWTGEGAGPRTRSQLLTGERNA